MPFILQEGDEEVVFINDFFRNFNEDISYKGVVMPGNHVMALCDRNCTSAKGISHARLITLAKDCFEAGILLNPLSAKKLAKIEHKGKADSFIEKYKDVGLTKCKSSGKKETEKELEVLFKEEKRFHGRAPQILPQIAAACDYYKIQTETAVKKFAIMPVRTLLTRGIPKVEAVLLYTQLSEYQLSKISDKPYIAQMVSALLDKSFKKDKKGQDKECKSLYDAALWIANHAESDVAFLEKIYSKVSDLKLDETVTIDNVRTQLSNNKALNEVAKIEKAYKKCGFKLKNCVCELRKTTSKTDRYKAEILEGNDPRQVMLGYDTDCCQHLGEAGESAMMHGLLHPKAGFWVVTKADSGKVVAQAEVWELNDSTLVLDNIEFANDAEIDQYKEIIGKWVSESAYESVIMGCGYNTFDNGSFEYAGAVVPPVTPYELYVLSYEEDAYARDEILELESEEKARQLMESGEITYYDYIYCDSENVSVYLKRDGRIADFFDIEQDYEEEYDEER